MSAKRVFPMNIDVNLIRIAFMLALVAASMYLNPLQSSPFWSGFIGFIFALSIIFFETRIRRASLKTLIGGAFGSVLGIIGASLIGFLISVQSGIPGHLKSYLTLLLIFFMGYVGLIVGAIKGDYLNLSVLGGLLHNDSGTKQQHL